MSVIDEYLAKVNAPQRVELQRIRKIVNKIVPEAQEVISYKMPSFKYKDQYLVGFNAFRDHMSLFPTSEPIDVFKDQLKGYKLAKGTIQFTLDNPISESLIKDIVLRRMANISKTK